MKVLITDITSYKAIVFAKSLNGSGHEIHTSDFRKISRYIRTRYSQTHHIYTNPREDEKRFISDLASIITKHKIDVLIPVNSYDTRVLLKHKAVLHGTLDYFGEYNTFLKLDNKKHLSSFTEEYKIQSPKSYRSEIGIIHFPVVFKPSESSSSKGVTYHYNTQDLEQRIREYDGDGFVIQDYIVGFGAGYSVLAHNGKIIAGCGHKRELEFPSSGGSSTVRSYYEHPGMVEIASKIIKATNWSGFAMFEFKINAKNEAFLIEINPRIWGSFYQSIASGTNFPVVLCDFLSDKPLSIMQNKQTITCLSPLYLFSLYQYVRKGEFKKVKPILKNFFRMKRDVSFFKDPVGYLAQLMVFIR